MKKDSVEEFLRDELLNSRTIEAIEEADSERIFGELHAFEEYLDKTENEQNRRER